MEKLTYLYDFEFKRNVRNYIAILSTFSVLVFLNIAYNLSIHNKAFKEIFKGKDISKSVGEATFSNLITNYTMIIIIFGFLICLLYTFIIWNRDFSSKNRSIYTLLMTPNKKYKIYIAKFLNSLSLPLMYFISMVLTLFISNKLLLNFMSGAVVTQGFVNDVVYSVRWIIPFNIEDFILVYFVIAPFFICLISMVTLLSKKETKLKMISIGVFLLIGIVIILLIVLVSGGLLESYQIERLEKMIGYVGKNYFKFMVGVPFALNIVFTFINIRLINGKFKV